MSKDISKEYNRYIDTAITLLEEMKVKKGTDYFSLNKNKHNRTKITVNDLLKKAYTIAEKSILMGDDE